MTHEQILAKVDHTLLAQTATTDQILALCDDALHYHAASVCIPPCHVRTAAAHLKGALKVCTVIGFPNGNTTTACKLMELKEAIENGAQELDMVINIGWLKEGRDDLVLDEIRQLKKACGSLVLKVIIETCLLSDEEKIRMCHIVTEAGADYIKTSTGFSAGGATFDDIALFAAHIGPNVKIKAAGGITSFEDAERFIELGASRLGTSRLIKLEKS